MNKHRTSAELKSLAKEKLSGHYKTAVMSSLIVYGMPQVLSTLLPSGNLLVSLLTSVIAAILAGMLQIGLSYLFLNIACNAPYSPRDIYYAFQTESAKALKLSLIQAGASLVPLLPYQIFLYQYFYTRSTNMYMLALIAMAIGLLLYVPLTLALSQTYYLLLDFPEYDVRQLLQESCRLMKGNMGRLFYIQASFLPLMLLGILSLFIGFLWILPYMQMTYTLFFLDLMNS